MKLYLATSDKTSHILKAFAWLADKYIPEFDEIIVLGYSVFPELPSRFKCVSLAPKQNSPSEWSMRLYEYFKNITDNRVLFGLDDFLPVKGIDFTMLNDTLFHFDCTNAVRYELGVGHSWHIGKKQITDTIYEYGQESLYRISTQFSIWDREYLVNHLHGKLDAQDFEKTGSENAKNDGKVIIATNPCAWDWVQAGALSGRHPDMINVLGIQREDVEEMISLGILERERLQLGMNIEPNPKYK